jgi:uncharacterized membrane protein YbhN (UPF0104 family)
MSPSAKRAWVAVKTVLALAIIVGVGVQFWRILNRPELADPPFALRWPYLALSGGLYLAAHIVWGTFWWQLLRSLGAGMPWPVALRAYFVSQFGKYVPGKVWVLLIRVGLLRPTGVSPAVVAVTAGYETLTNMAAGAMLAASLVPLVGVGGTYVSGNTLLLVGIAALPAGAWLFIKIAGRIARRARGPDARPLPNPPVWLLLAGLLQAAVGWCLLGISLGAAVHGVHPEPPPPSAAGFVRLLAAVAAAYVVGFIVLVSPGGLGPREFLLKEFLAADFAGQLPDSTAEATAVVVALVLRLVWTVFEVMVAAGWYLVGATHSSGGKGIGDHAE